MVSSERRRLAADDRRSQLLGIGLSKLVNKPIQDLSMDEVAAEAGISRGLLFHYFPTKTDFYVACTAAAGRRVLRNTAPDPTTPGSEQVSSMVRLMVGQIDRRRAFYLSLVHGTGAGDARVARVYESVRDVSTDRVMQALALDAGVRPLVHAWWAYVEDLAVTWSAEPPRRRKVDHDWVVGHAVDALRSLLALS
ncbi:MAG: TetR/AcrR family transcriptional regulator [Candidatus Nanopelagicales bacterium]